MKSSQKHIINKLTVEVFTNSKNTGEKIQENLTDFLRENLLIWLEGYFAQLEKNTLGGNHLRLDNLTLELSLKKENARLLSQNPSSLDQIKGEFLSLLKETFKETIRSVDLDSPDPGGFMAGAGKKSKSREVAKNNRLSLDKSEEEYFLTKPEHLVQTWLTFLKTGLLPWWIAEVEFLKQEWRMENLLRHLEHTKFQKPVWEALKGYNVRLRLSLHYREPDIFLLFLTLFQLSKPQKLEFSERFFQLSHSAQRITVAWCKAVWAGLAKQVDIQVDVGSFSDLDDKSLESHSLWEFIQMLEKKLAQHSQIWQQSSFSVVEFKRQVWRLSHKGRKLTFKHNISHNLKKPKQNTEWIKKWDSVKKEEEIQADQEVLEEKIEAKYLSRAGLIILYPFLPSFFEDCKIWNQKDKVWINQEKGVHLLYYVATMAEEPWEFELGFEKFLCGVPLEKPISPGFKVSEEDKAKSDRLLEGLLGHWKNIKSTTIDTIRLEFLQRSGKLEYGENAVTLHMERKAQDILLKGLDWGLGMVKLPWKKELIVVNW